MKIEVKDLKELNMLKNDLEKSNDDRNIEHQTPNVPVPEENVWNMWRKDRVKGSTPLEQSYETIEEDDEEFNCVECDITKAKLERHIYLKHTIKGKVVDSEIQCKYSGKQFEERSDLMYHRKSEHLQLVAYCNKANYLNVTAKLN